MIVNNKVESPLFADTKFPITVSHGVGSFACQKRNTTFFCLYNFALNSPLLLSG